MSTALLLPPRIFRPSYGPAGWSRVGPARTTHLINQNSSVNFDRTQCLPLWFFVQKVFETNLNFREDWTSDIYIKEIKGTFIVSILKADIMIVPLFSLMFYLLVHKIEICLKHFLDENSQKQPQLNAGSSLESAHLNLLITLEKLNKDVLRCLFV